MTTLADNGYPNLVNILKRTDPNGKLLALAEMLDKDLDFLSDIPFVEGNLPTGHMLAQRTALPSSSAIWRGYNEGGPTLKSDNNTFTEVCGLMEGYTKIDERLAALNGNAMEFRNSEAKAVTEMFSEELASSIFYKSVLTTPKAIHGLSARYPNVTGYTSSDYVRNLGTMDGGEYHSIWLLTWDPDYIFGIYPKASSAGLRREDLGKQLITDSSNKSFEAWVEKFQMECGLAVRDYRYAVRLQWDIDDVADSGKTLYLAIDEMFDTIKRMTSNTRLYMDRTSMRKLTAQLGSNAQSSLEWAKVNEQPVRTYRGVPIRVTDALVTETVSVGARS